MKLNDPSIFDNLLEAVLITDSKYGFLYANSQFCNLTGLAERRLKGKDLSEMFPLKKWIKKPSINQDSQILDLERTPKSVQVCAENIQLNEAESMFFYVKDISVEGSLQGKYREELKQKEVVIQRLERKVLEVNFMYEMAHVLQNPMGGDEVFHAAVELILRKFNCKRVALVGYEKDMKKILATAGPTTERGFWQGVLDRCPPGIFTIETKPPAVSTGALLLEIDEPPIKENQDLLSSAISQLMTRVEQENKMNTDEKTGLSNSRFLQAALDREIKRSDRYGDIFGLMVIDIDFFKKFNDKYGHQIGDEVLVHVAKLIKSVTRNTDVVARFGGEEFCVIAVKASIPGIQILMDRIRAKVELNPLKSAEHGDLKVTVSVGAALYPDQAKGKEELFSKADQALYLSKGGGRNMCTLWVEKT